MTINIEDELGSAMRDEVAGIALTTDVVGTAARRHRRRTTVRRTLYAAAVVGLAGALTATATSAGQREGPDTARPPSTAKPPPSPNLHLAVAIAASMTSSYRFTFTYWVVAQPGVTLTDSDRDVLARYAPPGLDTRGAFDPATVTGYLVQPRPGSGDYEQRLVNGTFYHGKGGRFVLEHGQRTHLAYGLLDGRLAATADPAALLTVLRDSGTVTQTAPDTYRFQVTMTATALPGGGYAPAATVTGEVLVADGKVSTLTYEESMVEQDGRVSGLIHHNTMHLSDYGTPVTVERPAVR